MKNTMLRRVLMLVLAMAMLLGSLALVSCGEDEQTPDGSGNGDGQTTTQKPGDNEGGVSEITGEELDYLPTEFDYGNKEFYIWAPKQNVYGTGHYVHAEGSNEIIDNALYDRELLMQDLFGVVLKLNQQNVTTIINTLNSEFRGRKSSIDIIAAPASNTMNAAMSGSLWNLNILDELNLEASYYDQRIQQNFRVNDMLFQITGDYEVLDELVTFGVLYNDAVYKDLLYYDTYGTPYEMVRNYQWTYATMMEMAANFTSDIAGEQGKMDQEDQWGIVSEDQACYYFYMGSGIQPMSSVDGSLYVNLNDTTLFTDTVDILQDILQFGKSEHVLLMSNIVAGGGKDRAEIASDIFEVDRALFRTTSLSDALYCGEMESDFGILPVPMYDAEQRAYYSQINADAAWPFCIPFYVKDIHKTAAVLERLSYYSRYGSDTTLYGEFFERLTYAKVCRKADDYAMMELIFGTKVFCIDTTLPMGKTGIRSTVLSLVQAEDTSGLRGSLEKGVENANSTLADFADVVQMMCETQGNTYGN